jgi:hypothetical protein
MGACDRNMWSDSAEVKPAQCCIKLVFHLTYTMMHGSTKLKVKLLLLRVAVLCEVRFEAEGKVLTFESGCSL